MKAEINGKDIVELGRRNVEIEHILENERNISPQNLERVLLSMAETMNLSFTLRDIKTLLSIYEKIRGRKSREYSQIKRFLYGLIADYLVNLHKNIENEKIEKLKEYKNDMLERAKYLIRGKKYQDLRSSVRNIAALEYGMKYREKISWRR